MTTEAALLQAVAADIDDRAAWQVYLDWLLEREDPRAELVRLQTELEDVDDDRETKAIEKQISALLAKHGKHWLREVMALKLPVEWAMHRGVVGRVAATPAKLANRAVAILEAAPLLMGVGIAMAREIDRDLSPLAGSALLGRIRELTVSCASPARVAGWQHLIVPELRSLGLSMLALGAEDVQTLVRGIPKLESLRVSLCRLNKRALEPLANLDAPTLGTLDLAAGHVGEPLGAIIARFPALRVIRIPGNELGSAGLAAMLPALGSVTHLDLRGNELTPGDLPALLAALPRVRVLRIGGNEFGAEACELIATWPGAQHLTQLDIPHGGNALALARSEHLSPALVKLTLGAPGLPPEVEHALLDAPRLANARIYVGMRQLARKKREAELKKSST